MAVDFHPLLDAGPGRQTSSPDGPKSIEVQRVGRRDADALSVGHEITAQALEVCLRTPECRRISLNKVCHVHGIHSLAKRPSLCPIRPATISEHPKAELRTQRSGVSGTPLPCSLRCAACAARI